MVKELPHSISRIIGELNRVPELNNETLNNIVLKAEISENDFKGLKRFDHPENLSYGRQELYCNERFKILLMSWRANDFTAIHNHGATEWGCVFFMGSATHRIYEIENERLVLKRKDIFQSGQTADVCGNFIHIMGNSGAENFMTLHIYGSDSDTEDNESLAKIYAPEHNKIFYTHGEAYLNISNELITGKKYFDRIDPEALADYLLLVKPFYERVNNSLVLAKIKSVLAKAL
jgi:predicted metal-dependent enzyme (double-stranded beta helix superfamily)